MRNQVLHMVIQQTPVITTPWDVKKLFAIMTAGVCYKGTHFNLEKGLGQ